MSLISNWPQLLAAVAGIAVACALWSTAVRPALLLLMASLIELLTLCAGAWFRGIYIPSQLHATDAASISVATLIGVIGLVIGMMHAIAMGILIWAVATNRRSRSD